MKSQTVPFRLVAITTEDFSTVKSNFQSDDINIGINLAVDVQVNAADYIVAMATRFEFHQNTQPILTLESICHFQVDDKYWPQFVKDESLVIPANLLTHFLVLAVGTARGIIHAKRPMWLQGLILPTLDVSKLIIEDRIFALNGEEE